LQLNEEQLLSGLINKDQLAFRELVDQYGSRVYTTSLNIVLNTTDAEDISQEVFVEIFLSIPKFKGESKLSTWIYRIAITKSLEFLRRRNRKKRFAFISTFFDSSHESLVTNQVNFIHPGVQLENKERAFILFKAIDQLPENQKAAFVLNKIEGLSYSEVADVLNTSVPSVESLLFRARQNLRKSLSEYYDENEK